MCVACLSAGFVALREGVLDGAAAGVAREISAADSGRARRGRLSELLEQIADKHGWQIVAKDGMADHVHLFVGVGPADAPAPVVRAFKGRTARVLRRSFRTCAGSRRCCGRRRISPPRSVMSRRRRCAATSSTSGMRWRRETGVCVPAAPDRASAHRVGGVCGSAPRAVQRGVAGTSGCVVAQQDPHPLRGSVRAADRDPVGAPGSGGVVVLQPAGHAAPTQQGVRRVLPPGEEPGTQPGYPRFKGKARFDSVEWPKDGDGARWLPEQRRVYLQGIGQVKVHLHRQVQGRVKTIQVKRQGRRWMLVLSCDDVPTNPLPAHRPPRRYRCRDRAASPPSATGPASTILAGAARPRPVGCGAAAARPRQASVDEPQTEAGDGRGAASQDRQPAQGLSPQTGPRLWSAATTCWWWRT